MVGWPGVRDVLEWVDVDDPTSDPVPMVDLDGHCVVTDGHPRAFVAYLSGADRLAVVRDPDREPRDVPRGVGGPL